MRFAWNWSPEKITPIVILGDRMVRYVTGMGVKGKVNVSLMPLFWLQFKKRFIYNDDIRVQFASWKRISL